MPQEAQNLALLETQSQAKSRDNLPPMLVQYLEYKANYPDGVIFFQVGDFYEIFFDDAITVSKKLNLTLTTRDKNNPNPVPMAGVPVHSVDNYLDRLVALGFSVIVVSQLNSPSQNKFSENGEVSSKVVIQRKVTRILTPGVRLYSNAESGSEIAIASSLAVDSEHEAAIAWCHAQSGKILVRENLAVNYIYQELKKINPAEVLLPAIAAGKRIDKRTSWIRKLEQFLPHASLKFRSSHLIEALAGETQGKLGRNFSEIQGYSNLSPVAKRAVRMLLDYLDEIAVEGKIKILSVETAKDEGHLAIDAVTRDNLELVKNLRGQGT